MAAALLVITDGRTEYLCRTVASARPMLRGDITERWMYDDTGDPEHRAWLRRAFPEFTHFDAGPRQGFSGAMQAVWAKLVAESRAEWAFHLEQDFVIRRPVNVDVLADMLTEHPLLTQIGLLRQPWYEPELATGGILQRHPDSYTERTWRGRPWFEHRRHWSCNPSLYPRWLMERGWPDGPDSEVRFGEELYADPRGYSAGYWGDGSPWVEHIGAERAGTGY